MSQFGPSTPVAGEIVASRYRLGKILDEGAIGIVFQATDSVLGRELAIKMLSPRVVAHPEARRRFERQVRASAAIEHPNAVKIRDFGYDEGRPYIAMELLRGSSLADHVSAMGKPALARTLKISYDVADVLADAHAEGLIHRDIKPENIFLERSGDLERVVVLGLGLASLVEGQDVGAGCDIYALGRVIFELVTGRPPYVADATSEILDQRVRAPAPNIRDHIPGAPAALDELLQRMLAERVEDRPTAAAVRRRLAALEQATLG